MNRLKHVVLVVSALGLAAFIVASIPYAFDKSVAEINVRNIQASGHTNQYSIGEYLLADFTNDMRALFLKQCNICSLMWRQVGNGWSTNGGSPSSAVCDAQPTVPGCQPPGPTSASALFLGCHQPGCALWRFSFSASNATKYRIQSSAYSFGPWSTWTVTSNNTYLPHLAQNPRYFRIRGENSAGVGSWDYLYTTGQCGGGGGVLD